VELKLAKVLQLIGTIKRTIIKKVRTKNILKLYNTLVLPTFLIQRCSLVAGLDFDSLTETNNWGGRNEVIETSDRLRPL
jgi:hypothetical protein